MAILYKTYNGQKVSVMRDAVPSDVGYDASPGSDQPLLCVLVDADRLAAWESKERERVRAAPEAALVVRSR